MNRRICSRSSTKAGSETDGRTHSCRFCSKLCGVSGPAATHTVLSWRPPASSRPVAVPPLLSHTPQPADVCLVIWHTAAVFAAMPTSRNAGVHPYMHVHPQQGRRAARCCLGLQHSHRRSRCCFCGSMPIFLNFVTFSTKHGWTLDKACSRPLGSRYVHANAHRRPWSRFRVFAAETSSVLDYI